MLRGSVSSTNSREAHTFSRAPQAAIPRSKFNRSHGCKTTFNEGYLVPVLVDEMLPGDTFNLRMTAFARLATPIFPIMDNLYLESFFFAVPYRLVWENWEKFNGYQVDPGDSTSFSVPVMAAPHVGGVVEGTLADYMGVPTGIIDLEFDSLHLRAYNLIWNEWFRDENQQDSVVVDIDNGSDTYTDYVLLRRGKRYDYFTSCLPFPQKGPDVELPLGTTAPIIGIGKANQVFNEANQNVWETGETATTLYANAATIAGGGADINKVFQIKGSAAAGGTPQIYADLSDATAATINDLRLAFQTQKLYERDARGGTRYTEVIKSHFGVVSPDMRLQRPEYLGGGSTPVIINPVAQTSATSGSNALGQLAAYGICAPEGHGFTYSATEHCLILGLVSVRADLNYQQGLERMWSRQTRLDYYWPALSHIGEQGVLNKEIYAQGPAVINPVTGVAYDEEVFGYQERYAEYRYKPSIITGLFRSQATGTLDSWHLAQDFGSLPELGEVFIVEDAPMTRVKAVNTQPDFIFDAFFQYHCARPMPVYAIPGLVDHF
ncbi:MAG: major capsid protein [Arizlama microvirus]|nr:MAG: major capsid protein [Arizlama microvirus]